MGAGRWRYPGFTSLDAWAAATGQEKRDGVVVGLNADPLLSGPGGGTLTDPVRLATLAGYRLRPGSPAIDRGLDLSRILGTEAGTRDFFGGKVPAGAGFDMGAHEAEP